MFLSLLLIFCFVIVSSTTDIYPTCGDCYCIPDNNGLGQCPNWIPETIFSNEVIKTYQNQIPNSIYTLNCNPYIDKTCTTVPLQTNLDIDTSVCAFSYKNSLELNNSCNEYNMITYSSKELAEASGDIVTHAGSCGLCSTTQDLSVYLFQDFTDAGKKCATRGLLNETDGLNCYMDLGLTLECAKIWNYDGIYDGKICATACIGHLSDPNNGPAPSCQLNQCLQCDEDYAGPIFSSFGGRTRRRSGLLSEIIRSCSSITKITTHNPCPY